MWVIDHENMELTETETGEIVNIPTNVQIFHCHHDSDGHSLTDIFVIQCEGNAVVMDIPRAMEFLQNILEFLECAKDHRKAVANGHFYRSHK